MCGIVPFMDVMRFPIPDAQYIYIDEHLRGETHWKSKS